MLTGLVACILLSHTSSFLVMDDSGCLAERLQVLSFAPVSYSLAGSISFCLEEDTG
jgi:hypothetical protein